MISPYIALTCVFTCYHRQCNRLDSQSKKLVLFSPRFLKSGTHYGHSTRPITQGNRFTFMKAAPLCFYTIPTFNTTYHILQISLFATWPNLASHSEGIGRLSICFVLTGSCKTTTLRSSEDNLDLPQTTSLSITQQQHHHSHHRRWNCSNISSCRRAVSMSQPSPQFPIQHSM